MPTKSHTLSADDRKQIDDSNFAFPDQRKEPLENASHVRNAIARFDQVKAAAKKFGVDMKETSWHQLGSKAHTKNSSN